MAKKRAPMRLSERANRLWRETLEVYELAPHEYPILEAACRELDIIDEIAKQLRGAPYVVRGSMGQDVANPLLAEVRHHRAAYVSLVRALGLPDAEAGEMPNPRSSAAQRAAQARWSRGA